MTWKHPHSGGLTPADAVLTGHTARSAGFAGTGVPPAHRTRSGASISERIVTTPPGGDPTEQLIDSKRAVVPENLSFG